MKLLITNTLTRYENGNPIITVFGRDPEGNRRRRDIVGMEPYFYAPTPGVNGRKTDLLGSNGIVRLEGPEEHSYSPVKEPSRDITKVVVETPGDVRSAKENFDETWDADIQFTNRFRIDYEIFDWIEVPDNTKRVPIDSVEAAEPPEGDDPDPRVLTVDIEVDDRGGFPEPEDAPNRVTCIVAHDSYADETVGFLDLDGRAVEDALPDGKPAGVDELHFEPNEKRMLIRFASYVDDIDPDVLTGWNFEDFDAPYLINRMESVGAQPSRLSPVGTAYVDDYDTEAVVRGRTCYDLLQAYKDSQFSELRSYSLDYVAQAELDEAKLEFDGTFWEIYQNDVERFVDYCARDVDLTRRINEKAGTLDFKDSLRKQVGVDFEETRNNYQYIEMMVRRRLYERNLVGPTKEVADYEDYGGGHVFDAYNGVARNVMGIDVESLYPWTMYMLNSSPETKVSDGKAEMLRQQGRRVATAPNGVNFKLPQEGEERGLFASLVKDALDLKEGYRDKKNAAEPGSKEEAEFATKYSVAKTITNSIYGVIGWEHFFLYDADVAEAVTTMGQSVIQKTAAFSSDWDRADLEVVYGDTDSNYISFPGELTQEQSVKLCHQLCEDLENEAYTELAEQHGMPADQCEWRIDPEMFTPRFFQWGRKKFYAYRPTWKEGMDFGEMIDKPKTKVKGSSSQRSDRAKLTQELESDVIEAILDGREGDVPDMVHEYSKEVTSGDPDWEYIGIPGGIGKPLDEYPENYAHAKAARNANALLDTDLEEGSKPMRVEIKSRHFEELGRSAKWLAYESARDIEQADVDVEPNRPQMLDKTIESPLGPIVNAIGYDVGEAIRGNSAKQMTLQDMV